MSIRHRFALPALVLALLGLAVAPVHAGVIAHWTFEEGPADTAATGPGSILDSSGNGLHGTPVNGPVFRDVGGSLALEFDRDYVLVEDSPLFVSRSMTVEAIISINAFTAGLNQIAFRGDHRAGDDPFYLALNSGRLHWQLDSTIGTGGNTSLLSPTVLPLGELLHVAGTIDDATGLMSLFVNGALVAQQTTAVRPIAPVSILSPCGVSIGALEDCNPSFLPGQYFDGLIAELRISDMALAPNQFLGASAVPEPGAMALMGLAFLVAFGPARRRRFLPAVG